MKNKKIMFLFAVLLLVYITFIEPSKLILKEQNLYIPNWNKDLNGFKIGIVSDLHIGSKFVSLKKVRVIADKINKTSPDLIVFLGDLDAKAIYHSKYSSNDIIKCLNLYKAKYGTIAVLGNHDYYPDNIVRDIIKNSNITLLENQTKYILVDGTFIKIVGLKDLWHAYFDPYMDILKDEKIPTIVLSHNPDVFPNIPNYISLTISGHNHGGEIYFPFIGSFTVPSEYGDKYRKGYYIEDCRHLYVSGGVGTLSHMRFCNPPEINVVCLYKQKKKIKNKGLKKFVINNYLLK